MRRENILVLVSGVALIAFSVPLALSFNKARGTGDYSNVVGYLIPVAISLFVLVARLVLRRAPRP
jgi:hypothetical protein